MGMFGKIATEDAFRKARGEPTVSFHNIVPNRNHPEIAAIYAARKKAQQSKALPKVEQKQTGGTVLAPQKTASQKAKPATPRQKEGRVPTVKRKTQSRGRTIMNPLAGNNEGSTYRKKLLGD